MEYKIEYVRRDGFENPIVGGDEVIGRTIYRTNGLTNSDLPIEDVVLIKEGVTKILEKFRPKKLEMVLEIDG